MNLAGRVFHTTFKRVLTVAAIVIFIIIVAIAVYSTGNIAGIGARDCGNSRQCFYEQFESCARARIATVQTTIEGDPITIKAEIGAKTDKGCPVYVTTDYAQDRLLIDPSLPKVYEDTCYGMQLDRTQEVQGTVYLNATRCEDQSRGDARSI